MKVSLMQHLACPKCKGELVLTETERQGNEILAGVVRCHRCSADYPVIKGVPRFCGPENYTASFGFQWNQFSRTQIDSLTGLSVSRDRFARETAYAADWKRGRTVLDAGCGAGRFLDVARHECGTLIGVDFSAAVDASYALTWRDANVHIVQASIYELPFPDGHFDGVYSIGVIQHTPDPKETIRRLVAQLKIGGVLALTMYERKPWTHLNAKYVVRPVTRRIPPRALYWLLVILMPVLFPLTYILYRLPKLGRLFSFVIPVADYSRNGPLSVADEYRAVLLDTFDMLSPAHDHPLTKLEVEGELERAGMEDFAKHPFPSGSGVNVVARKGRA
jgi:SAM-dependent methyltransferase